MFKMLHCKVFVHWTNFHSLNKDFTPGPSYTVFGVDGLVEIDQVLYQYQVTLTIDFKTPYTLFETSPTVEMCWLN